ncbi:hypothetical protein FHX15_003081 [Rhizobium sp. BK650]|uniref:hypothetical protein n=1 Tax=Rhizobium sp. BK650 TaxID=2586990 RepID=UPI0016149E38|nr:hypothetical protein [Rhizobium sp. BK650]MBB3657839.1 hypothetical protein [Rhizobium sp. BK650]
MFTAFRTFLAKLFRGDAQRAFEIPTAATVADAESRLRSLREEELFFWQPTPLSWY